MSFTAPPKVVEEFSGKVIGFADGDTVKVLVGELTATVRLERPDVPESVQNYGKTAKEALTHIVAGKVVTVKKTGTDAYKCALGFVFVGKVEDNAKLIEYGWAWHFK